MKNIDNNKQLTEALKNDKLILVDFWAPWCQPCKALEPIIAQVEELIPVYKCNIDLYPELAQEYNIQKIPTILLLNSEGTEIARNSGLMTKTKLEEFIEDGFNQE